MRYILLILIVLKCTVGFTQKPEVVMIHPAIGDTINLHEKRHFHLLTFFSDDDFRYAYVLRNSDSSYVVRVKTLRSGLQEKELEDSDPLDMFKSIEATEKIEGSEWRSASGMPGQARIQFKRPPPRTSEERENLIIGKTPGQREFVAGGLMIVLGPVFVLGGGVLALTAGWGGPTDLSAIGIGIAVVGLIAIPVAIVLLIRGATKKHLYKKQQRLNKVTE